MNNPLRPTHSSPGGKPAALPFTAADLGFEASADGWWKQVGDIAVAFRPLRRLPDLLSVETLQRAVFGVTDRDLLPASALVVIPETGGEVIGAFADDGGEPGDGLIGFVAGWGGFFQGRPRLVSDMLGVRANRRRAGLGAELKRLQAAVALAQGFVEIVWTVDPLRAANARLNIEKLGAVADRYEENRYGTGYGAGLYGDLPTDRLHLTWPIDSERVRDRLLGRIHPTDFDQIVALPRYEPTSDAPLVRVPLPHDVDALLGRDPAAVADWRLSLRDELPRAFADGYVVVGFAADRQRGDAWYVLERDGEEAH